MKTAPWDQGWDRFGDSVGLARISGRIEFAAFGLAFGRGGPTCYPFSLLTGGLLKPRNTEPLESDNLKAALFADLCPMKGISISWTLH